jgi:hypothetical protein
MGRIAYRWRRLPLVLPRGAAIQGLTSRKSRNTARKTTSSSPGFRNTWMRCFRAASSAPPARHTRRQKRDTKRSRRVSGGVFSRRYSAVPSVMATSLAEKPQTKVRSEVDPSCDGWRSLFILNPPGCRTGSGRPRVCPSNYNWTVPYNSADTTRRCSVTPRFVDACRELLAAFLVA